MKPDEYGHCCLCHKNLIVPRVVGGEQIMMLTPEFDQTEFIISNNSRMVVCMCRTCKSTVDLNNTIVHNKIMESVKLGWSHRNDRCPPDHENLNILFYSEGIDDYVVKNRINKLGI